MEEVRKSARVGGQEAGYLFEFKPNDGVYLTVYPAVDSAILFELSDMRQILKEYGVLDYDMVVLARAVRSADGTRQRLAEHFEASVEELYVPLDEPQEPTEEVMPFRVELAKDRMTATLVVDRAPRMLPPDKEAVMEALCAQRVVYGIDEAAIDYGIQHGTETVIARGLPAEQGQDARIERRFNLDEKGKPVRNMYDQVDFKNLRYFLLAREGDILAERIPHTMGKPGTNILGTVIRPKPGKPRTLAAGKNTEVRDTNFLVALVDGQIVDNGSVISVDPRLEISGDVGVETGNIDFIGAVEINGSVQQGFSVKAAGDIIVKGAVSGGQVEGNNVYVTGGVLGVGAGKVTAKEDVHAAFVENGVIEAGGNIFVSDVVFHSELRAGGIISVEEKRGLVTGGLLMAGEEIRAKVIGNMILVSSRLVVGENPALQKEYQQAIKDYTETKEEMERLTKALHTLGKIDIAKLPPQRAAQLTQLTRSQFRLAGQMERGRALIETLEGRILRMKKARIRVADCIYPGQKITISSVMKNLQTEERRCTFYVKDEEVVTGPY